MKKEKAWVWFKGGLQGGEWIAGFMASASEEGGFLIERPDYVTCRVPAWRVIFKKPDNEKQGPTIPEGEPWRYF